MYKQLLAFQRESVLNQDKKRIFYQIAVPIMMAASVTWLTLHPIFEVSYRTPFLLYFVIIFLGAIYGGSFSAIIATLSAAVLSLIFILPEYETTPEFFIIAIGIFFAEGLVISGLFLSVERIRHKLAQSEKLLQQYRSAEPNAGQLEVPLNEFLHLASHELKTPVTSIKGFTQILKKKHQNQERQEDLNIIDRIEGQSTNLTTIIENILDATQISKNALHINKENFDLISCLSGVITEKQRANRLHFITTNFPNELWIHGDQRRLAQVFTILIDNALKFTPEKTEISITILVEDDYVQVRVKDQGPGIPKAQQSEIFDRFTRTAQSVSKALPGMGLGLYVAKEIVKKHRGYLGVISDEGNGAEFWFSLPRQSGVEQQADVLDYASQN
ncbi:PhoR [Pedobacter sp. BAL39]|uniref:ATP-binding protein n=1 Tax=Pedobacter sp. BAL39 TaxID=391596 RepID=UPI000155A1D8|nr:ATP-binding protein [Pedobacter sp. BAL39]EDM37937.1 PhoR [Pedobacter sp. BAL39]